MTTISIVDDDRIVREAIGDLVESLGYDVATYECAEDFLGSGRLTETSCLITDIQMPGLDGLGLQRELLAQGHPTPTIFVTAFPDEKCRQCAMSAGAIGYLSKPFDEAALIECLEAALSICPGKAEENGEE
jgi:FixJ family two-component response regulator